MDTEVINKTLTGKDAPVFKQMIGKPNLFDMIRDRREPYSPALKRFLKAFGKHMNACLVGTIDLGTKKYYEVYRGKVRGTLHYLALGRSRLLSIGEIRAVPQREIEKMEAERKKTESAKQTARNSCGPSSIYDFFKRPSERNV